MQNSISPQLAFALGALVASLSLFAVFQDRFAIGQQAYDAIADCEYELPRRETCVLTATPLSEIEVVPEDETETKEQENTLNGKD